VLHDEAIKEHPDGFLICVTVALSRKVESSRGDNEGQIRSNRPTQRKISFRVRQTLPSSLSGLSESRRSRASDSHEARLSRHVKVPTRRECGTSWKDPGPFDRICTYSPMNPKGQSKDTKPQVPLSEQCVSTTPAVAELRAHMILLGRSSRGNEIILPGSDLLVPNDLGPKMAIHHTACKHDVTSLVWYFIACSERGLNEKQQELTELAQHRNRLQRNGLDHVVDFSISEMASPHGSNSEPSVCHAASVFSRC
jgi:hypothetical protein